MSSSPYLPAGLRCPEAEIPSPFLSQAEILSNNSSACNIVFPQLGLFSGILFQQISKSLTGIMLASTTDQGLLAKKYYKKEKTKISRFFWRGRRDLQVILYTVRNCISEWLSCFLGFFIIKDYLEIIKDLIIHSTILWQDTSICS